MIAHRLPVSGIDVVVELPTGAEDVLLVEAGAPSIGLAIALLARLVRRIDNTELDWFALTPTDLDTLLLLLRRRVLGDLVRTDVVCKSPDCGSRVDISFSISAYLHHHRPETPEGLELASDGWLRLADSPLEFRLPRTDDQLAVALEPDPERALARRCIRGESDSEVARAEIDVAMEVLAPSLASELEGTCPECSAHVTVELDPLHYTLLELRDQAKYVYEDVCAIAARTHWSEHEILALPTVRRLRYADVIHDHGGA